MLEKLKTAYELTTPDAWYTENGNIYTMDDGYLVCSATENPTDAGNEQDDYNLEFIALAHNVMPVLLEAFALLDKAALIIDSEYPEDDVRYNIVREYVALRTKLEV